MHSFLHIATTLSQTRQRNGILRRCGKGHCNVQNAVRAAEKNAPNKNKIKVIKIILLLQMMMGATKKKRGPQQGYAQMVLDEAMQMIRMGRMSIRKVSILYQIPKSTLSDHASGRSTTQRKGPQPYLPKDIED